MLFTVSTRTALGPIIFGGPSSSGGGPIRQWGGPGPPGPPAGYGPAFIGRLTLINLPLRLLDNACGGSSVVDNACGGGGVVGVLLLLLFL